jgi:hypothetical protein
MIQIVNYFGRFQTVKGRVTGLPFFARLILTIFALPGLILLGLSIVAFVVSLFALLLLTVPVYRLLSALFLPQAKPQQGTWDGNGPEFMSPVSPGPTGRRHVEVKIIE